MGLNITREDIAEIYDSMARRELDLSAKSIPSEPSIAGYEDATEHLNRGMDFMAAADEYRKIDKMRPLRPDIRIPNLWVRATENLW